EKLCSRRPPTARSASTIVDFPPLFGPTRIVNPLPVWPVGSANSSRCSVPNPRRPRIVNERIICQYKTAGPFRVRLFEFILSFGLIIHAAHAAWWHWRSFFLFRNLRDQCFGGEQQARDRRSVLQRRARDLGRIDDPRLHQIGV